MAVSSTTTTTTRQLQLQLRLQLQLDLLVVAPHDTTLHLGPLHNTTFRYTTLITLHYATLDDIPLQHTILTTTTTRSVTTPHFTTLTSCYNTLQSTTL